MNPKSGHVKQGGLETDDPAYLLLPLEAALNDPTHLIPGLEAALTDPSDFARKIETAIEALGSSLGRNGGGEALHIINYLDRSIAEMVKKRGVGESDRAKLAQSMAFARKVAMKTRSR